MDHVKPQFGLPVVPKPTVEKRWSGPDGLWEILNGMRELICSLKSYTSVTNHNKLSLHLGKTEIYSLSGSDILWLRQLNVNDSKDNADDTSSVFSGKEEMTL